MFSRHSLRGFRRIDAAELLDRWMLPWRWGEPLYMSRELFDRVLVVILVAMERGDAAGMKKRIPPELLAECRKTLVDDRIFVVPGRCCGCHRHYHNSVI
jgi:hypothetical protein